MMTDFLPHQHHSLCTNKKGRWPYRSCLKIEHPPSVQFVLLVFGWTTVHHYPILHLRPNNSILIMVFARCPHGVNAVTGRRHDSVCTRQRSRTTDHVWVPNIHHRVDKLKKTTRTMLQIVEIWRKNRLWPEKICSHFSECSSVSINVSRHHITLATLTVHLVAEFETNCFWD